MRRLALLAIVLVWPATALAHHILGIPHYAYDEDYPQAPVLTYRVDAGAYEVKMTGYPGTPQPGESSSLYVYIRERGGGAPFDGQVRLTVMRDDLLGTDPIVYGPIDVRREESVFKFYPQFADEANYLARIEFQTADAPWIIDLPMVVGEPGSPWGVLAGVAAAVVVFLVVIRAARIKLERRRRGVARPARPAAVPG